MLGLPLGQWALIWLAIALAGLVQGTLGFGFAIVATPVLAMIHPDLVPVPLILLVFPLTVAMSLREFSHLDLRGVGWILLGRVPGMLIGLGMLIYASRQTLELAIAAIVLLAVVVVGTGVHIVFNRVTQVAAGLVSGITAAVAAMGGPPIALIYRSRPGGVMRSTLATIFALGFFITMTGLLSAGQVHLRHVKLALMQLPALSVGLFASRFFVGRLEGAPLRAGVLLLATFAAFFLGARALIP